MFRELSEEDDRGGGAYGCVLAEEGEDTGLPVDSESGDGIGSLIARVEIFPRGIDSEAARIVTAGPFLSGKGKSPVLSNGEPGDAVMQAVCGIKKPCVWGNEHFGSEICAFEIFRQS